MGVTVSSNFGPLAEMPLSNKQLMREIGLLARERILRRTASGRDQFDAAFTPYSPGYAKQKAQSLGGFGVNLQVSGAMLNAISLTEVRDDAVTLGFIA